jgi:GDP-L-fucose synthase
LMDNSKLEAQGWSSSIHLKDGIKRTYDWFLTNVNELREVN